MADITELRRQIDEIDTELVRLYLRRMETAAKIGDYKRQNGLPVYDARREEQLLERVSALAGPDHGAGVREMFRLLMAQSKAWQRLLLSNIVLIGMPGCGKSTVGELAARMLNRPLINTDVLIEKKAGISCGDYIRKYGEAAFRDLETAAIEEAAAQRGCVIATGGGVVTRPQNMELLRRQGVVFHILRPLEELEITPERPLSDTPQKLRALWEARGPLYEACRDYAVEGRDAAERAENVIALFKKYYL